MVTIMKKQKIEKSLVGIFKNMGENIPGGNFIGGNFPGGSFPDTVPDRWYTEYPMLVLSTFFTCKGLGFKLVLNISHISFSVKL